MLPRFFFAPDPERRPTVAEQILDNASHVKVDMWKTREGVIVSYEVKGTINDTEIGEPVDHELTRSAVHVARSLIRQFAASGRKDGGE